MFGIVGWLQRCYGYYVEWLIKQIFLGENVYFDTVMLGCFITNEKLVTLNIHINMYVTMFAVTLFSFVLDL